MPGGNLAHLWLILGCVLIALEVLVAGFYLVWFGVAALLTALVVYIFDPGLAAQGMTFAVFALASALIGKRLYHLVIKPGEKVDQLSDSVESDLLGLEVILVSDIKSGIGQAQVFDSIRHVHGDDLPKGALVKITEVSGSYIKVEKL